MPQCLATPLSSTGTRTRCESATFKQYNYCKAHADDYRGLMAQYKDAADDARKTAGGVAFLSQDVGSLRALEEVDPAIDFTMAYVMAFDREMHYRRAHNNLFFGGGTISASCVRRGFSTGIMQRKWDTRSASLCSDASVRRTSRS